VIVAAPSNRVEVYVAATKAKLQDSGGNEIYARLTEASGVYSLVYYSMVAGVETAYSFGSATAIDFEFNYRFDFNRYCPSSKPWHAVSSLCSCSFSLHPTLTSMSNSFHPSDLSLVLGWLAATSAVLTFLWRAFSSIADLRQRVQHLSTQIEFFDDRTTLTLNGLDEKVEHTKTRLTQTTEGLTSTVRSIENFLAKTTIYQPRG
jgi:hypothetical protein